MVKLEVVWQILRTRLVQRVEVERLSIWRVEEIFQVADRGDRIIARGKILTG